MSYKILNLKIKNMKVIEAIEICPKTNAIIISGENGNGKSTVLESILWTLAGERNIPENAVKVGERRGEIEIDLGDFKVRREFRGEKTSLIVLGKEGNKINSPQAFLNSIIEKTTFDPMVFMRSPEREQVEMLKKAMGVDFTELDEGRKSLEGTRLEIGREARLVQGQLREYEDVQGSFKEQKTRSMQEISVELGKLEADEEDMRRREQEVRKLQSRIERKQSQVAQVQEQIERLHRQTEAITEEIAEDEKELMGIEITGGAEPGKIRGLREELRQVAEGAKMKERYEQKEKLRNKLGDLEDEREAITQSLENIVQQKKATLEATQFPVPGIEFVGDSVQYKGLPISNASMAEKMKVSLAIAMAVKTKLKVITLEDGSLLDDESLEEVKKFAEKNDMQVWIERVGEEDNSFVIREGRLEGEPCESK